jgi:hypothetical protein
VLGLDNNSKVHLLRTPKNPYTVALMAFQRLTEIQVTGFLNSETKARRRSWSTKAADAAPARARIPRWFVAGLRTTR